jgi:hypothetical protein
VCLWSLVCCGSSSTPEEPPSLAPPSLVQLEIVEYRSHSRYPPLISAYSTHSGAPRYPSTTSRAPLAPPTPFQYPIKQRRKSSAARERPSTLKRPVVKNMSDHQLNEVARPMYDTLDGGKGALEQYAGHQWYENPQTLFLHSREDE